MVVLAVDDGDVPRVVLVPCIAIVWLFQRGDGNGVGQGGWVDS